MNARILVTYASKYGSTAQIADQISQVLAEAGLQVTEGPVEKAPDPGGFDAVVVGSAVYAGQWRKEASEWLKEHTAVLAERPTWIFSSGPTGEGDPVELMNGWRFPEGLEAAVEQIIPQDIAFFHGNLDMDKLNFGERMIVKAIKAPTGDFRDWDAIHRWAAMIGQSVPAEAPA